MVVILAIFGISTLLSASALANEGKYTPCLDYWAIGDSNCKSEVPKDISPTAVLPPKEEEASTQVATNPPPTLNERINEYMDDHGKPPREYVQFYLEPTLENAVKWVHTYNKILERNQRITYAWGQAEKLYDTAKSSGTDLSPLNDPNSMPVQDFGITVKGYTRPQGLNFPPDAPLAKSRAGINPYTNISSQGISLIGASGGPLGADIMTAIPPVPTLTPTLPDLTPKTPSGAPLLPPLTTANAPQIPSSPYISGIRPIEISYYFSADCPVCKKFEPGFNKIISELGNTVTTTCIDITPSGVNQANINGKVDCAWRPARQGELQKLGITKTPSIVINKGEGALERVIGFIEPERLKRYIQTGQTD